MHSAVLLSRMHCRKADKHPTESSSDTEHSDMTPSSSLENSDSEDDDSENSSSEAAVPTMSLNLRRARTKPKTPTSRTPSSNPIARRASKMQVNAVSDAKVDSYIARLNKEVSISYAKSLNASLFGGSRAKAAALQLLEEKLRKAKKRS